MSALSPLASDRRQTRVMPVDPFERVSSYQTTAAYGHFGREDHDFTWEKTDEADALRQAAGLGAEDPVSV